MSQVVKSDAGSTQSRAGNRKTPMSYQQRTRLLGAFLFPQIPGVRLLTHRPHERQVPRLNDMLNYPRKLHRFGSDPVKFARLVQHIIQSRNPAFRYALGVDAKAGIMGKTLLPERLFNKLLSTFTLRE